MEGELASTMTTCNAVICDDGNAIVLVADKMIGMGYVAVSYTHLDVYKRQATRWVPILSTVSKTASPKFASFFRPSGPLFDPASRSA